MVEIFVVIVVVVCIIGAFINTPKYEPPTLITTTRVSIAKPKPKRKTKAMPDPMWDAAKANLVMMGYSATEAKKMLTGLKCSAVEQYITQAMKRIKI